MADLTQNISHAGVDGPCSSCGKRIEVDLAPRFRIQVAYVDDYMAISYTFTCPNCGEDKSGREFSLVGALDHKYRYSFPIDDSNFIECNIHVSFKG